MKKILIYCCAVLFLFSACGEIFEEDIQAGKIQLIAPGDSLKTSTYAQNFIWQALNGARTYHLQIAEPSFDSLRTIVLDTLITTTRFTFSCQPGKYEWRVRGENAGYQTLYSKRSFQVFPSSLAQQQVILINPANELLTNQNSLSFSWSALFGAKNYTIQIDSNNFADTTKLVLNQTTASTALNYTFINDQNYQWRVRGQNDTARSAWSAVRRFKIDRLAPNAVSLLSPAKDASVSNPVNLTWQTLADASQYEVFVYQSDSTTVVSSFPRSLTGTNLSINLGTLGDRVVWRVRAKDQVGNIGAFSEYRSFLIQ